MSARTGWRTEARPLVDGTARGDALVLDEPLSLWGGLDAGSGLIVERRHPQHGQSVAGRILVMPAGRGSSSSSSILAESLRRGTGPAALLLAQVDEILVLGALVAGMLDGVACPIALLGGRDYARLRSGDRVRVLAGGGIEVRPASVEAP